MNFGLDDDDEDLLQLITKIKLPLTKKLLFFTTLLFLFYSQVVSQTGNFTGKIINSETKLPVFGALVSIYPIKEDVQSKSTLQTLSDVDGNFKISITASNQNQLLVKHLGFKPITLPIDLSKSSMIIELEPANLPLKEVVISALRNEKTLWGATEPIEIVNQDDFKAFMPADVSNAMATLPGISVPTDGIWATSVNIRGLGPSRFVTLVDGNRIESANNLSGVLSTIDSDDVQRVEVIKGAMSSLYGSGAMGGIINVVSRQSTYSQTPYLQGEAGFNYRSINGLIGPKLSLYSGGQRWKAKLHLGYRKAGISESPEGPIANSQFEDKNLSGSLAVKPFQNHELSLNFQKFMAAAGIPGGSVFPTPATATYRNFDRELFAVTYAILNPLPKLTKFSTRYFQQTNYRNVEINPNVPANTNGTNRMQLMHLNPSATHKTQGFTMETNWQLGKKGGLIAGADLWERRLDSQREREIRRETLDENGNPVSSISTIFGEVPIPTSVFRSSGFFTQYDAKISNKWNVTAGGRIDWIQLSNEESRDPDYMIINGDRTDEPGNQRIIYEEGSNSDLTWALNGGLMYEISEEIQLRANVGRSYRAPSLEERYKYINLGSAVEYGNPELVPELGQFFDLGGRISSTKLQLSGSVFVNALEQMIAIAPADSISFLRASDGVASNNILAYRYKNIDKALLTGFDASIDWKVYQRWIIHGNVSYTNGVNRVLDEPLPEIAPLNGIVGVKHHLKKWGEWNLRARLFAQQNRIAEGELATDGYVIMDFMIQSDPIVIRPFVMRVRGGMENIMNTAYRNHLSTYRGIWTLEPGRNINLSVNLKW